MTTIASAKTATTQIETGKWIAVYDGVAVARDDGGLKEFDTGADALAYLAERERKPGPAATESDATR